MEPVKRKRLDLEKQVHHNSELSAVKCTEPDQKNSDTRTLPETFLDIERSLSSSLMGLTFTHPVSYIYDPIRYAYSVHSLFVNKYCKTEKKIMLLGMNPGPWGMSQTGVPFGEVNVVRDWMGISGEVGHPQRENPAKPVCGFSCDRSEVSGQRLWGLIKEICGEAMNFFEHTMVYNHCPVNFMTESGKNITPAELKAADRNAVTDLCDKAFCEVLKLFQVSVIIAIGRYAEKRATTALEGAALENITLIDIPHPSPRNVGKAGEWKEKTIEILEKHGLMDYFRRTNSSSEATSSAQASDAECSTGKEKHDSSVT